MKTHEHCIRIPPIPAAPPTLKPTRHHSTLAHVTAATTPICWERSAALPGIGSDVRVGHFAAVRPGTGPAHMRDMLISDLLLAYASWLFATFLFVWMGSVLYRTTRNTFGRQQEQASEGVGAPTPPALHIPAHPVRKPRIPLTQSA